MSRGEKKALGRRQVMERSGRLLPVISAVCGGLWGAHAAQATNYAWQVLNAGNASGSWGVVTNWAPNLATATTGSDTALFNNLDITADSIISLNAPQTIGETRPAFPDSSMIFDDTNTATAAGWTINATSSTPNDNTNILTLQQTTANSFEIIRVNNLGAGKTVTINATVSDGAAGDLALAKAGAGTLVLTANNSNLTGAIAVNNGVLVLDFSQAWSPVANIIGDTSTGSATASHLQLQGGTLLMRGKSGASNSQTFSNGSALELGASQVRFDMNGATSMSLNMGTLSRNAGGVMDIQLPSAGSVGWAPGASGGAYPATALGTTTGTNGLLVDLNGSAYATVNSGADYAANNAGNIVPASTISGFYTPSTTSSLSGNADLVTNATLSGATSISSLHMSGAAAHTIDVGGSTLATGGILIAPGSGAMTIQNGNLTATSTAAGGDLIIHQSNTTNPLNVTATITDAASGRISVTKTGAGTLVLSASNTYTGLTMINGGVVSITGGVVGTTGTAGTNNVEVAPAFGNSATLLLSGGTLNGDRVLSGGNSGNFAGGNGTIIMTGGTLNSSQWFSTGTQGNGTFLMSGGVANQNSSTGTQMEVGVFGIGRGFINLSGNAQLNLLSNAPIVMGVFDTAGGTMTQSGNAQVTFYSDAGTTVGGTGNLVIGQDAGSSVYNLNGGTLSVGGISHGGTGTGILNLNGGTIKAVVRANSTLITGLTAARVGAGGAIIDTNGLSVTVPQGLLHDPGLGATPDGGLVKNGAGTLRLSGASTYTGPTVINSGILQLVNTAGVPVAVGNYSFDNVRNTSNVLVTSGPLADNYTVVNGGSGGTAMNGTVNNSENVVNPGTAGGSIVPGRFGNALSLDGTGSSVDINSQIVDQSSGNVSTMNVWVNTANPGGVFVGKNGGADTWAVGHTAYYLGSAPPNRATLGSLPTAVRFAGGFEQGTTSVTDSTWHMLTYVDTGAGKLIYVDGNQVIDPTQTGADGIDTSTFTRLGFNIDTFSNTDGTAHYAGAIDELKFYNIALTSTQISELFTSNAISTQNTGAQFLPATTAINVAASGAVLDLNGVNQTIGSLAGVAGSSVTLGLGFLTTGGNNTPTTFAGVVSGSGGIIKTGTGTFTMSGSNTYTGTTSVQGGTVRLLGDAAQAPVLTTGGGADITGGKLVMDYGGGGTNPSIPVKNILTAGFAEPTKFSTGQLRTSNPPDPHKGLGWRDANAQVVVAYVYYGDANIDGKVNALDFNALASNFGGSGKSWAFGDFNYDGIVNTADFTMLASNFNQSLVLPGAPTLGALVPEPASMGLVGLAWLGLSSRRRRRD